MATKKTTNSTPNWSDVKPKLADFDRAGLLSLVQDLYAASKDNKSFLHARFGLGDDPLEPYKDVTQWINPSDYRKSQSVAKAKKAIDEGFYDALVRMFEQALKYVLALPAGQQATFIARLDRVRQLGQNVGWGLGVDFDHFWSEAGLAGDT
jgi:hypothetical protein